jgi:hypothetical protein
MGAPYSESIILGGNTKMSLEAIGTWSDICMEIKGHCMSVHTSTSGMSIQCEFFLLQVFDFLGETFHFSQDHFAQASRRFIIRLYLFPSTSPLGL